MSTTLQIFIFVAIIFDKGSFSPISGYIDPTTPFEFSFVVSIARRFDITANNPFGHTCGGALITRRFILTAASCFSPGKTEKDYFVYAGSNDLPNAEKFEIQSWITYERWLKKRRSCSDRKRIYTNNDIAIVRLSDKVVYPVRPALISHLSPEVLVGGIFKTAGWGLLFNDTQMRKRFQADLRVISRTQCLENIRNASNDSTYFHEENFFCTNGAILFAVLDEGDKGSPVFVEKETGDYQIVGVNQKAAPWVNEVVRIPDQQNLHVSVHHYIDFLRTGAHLHHYL